MHVMKPENAERLPCPAKVTFVIELFWIQNKRTIPKPSCGGVLFFTQRDSSDLKKRLRFLEDGDDVQGN
jgi:hypothetical protein